MPVETRYLRSDSQTVNGLTAYVLGTTQSATVKTIDITSYSYLIFRVYKRSSDGTETFIFEHAWFIVADLSGVATEYSFTENCPQTSLVSTDAIVVKIFGSTSSSGGTLLASWITEQLGASQLNAATWTFYVWTQYSTRTGAITFRFGSSTAADSRITNFSWTPYVPPPGVPRFIGDGLSGAVIIV
jgi:hypothetical protein